MRTGTKSLLFGTHQFAIHPLFVLLAWIKIYRRFPSFRVFIAIVIHDWGYWGCENMDDEKGENHPVWAATVMDSLYSSGGSCDFKLNPYRPPRRIEPAYSPYFRKEETWSMSNFVLYHSRFLARNNNKLVSPLCLIDKYGVAMYPVWLWVAMATFSGEVHEYLSDTKYEIHAQVRGEGDTPWKFFKKYKKKCAEWISGSAPLEPWLEEE